jgi:hypothetical protein
MPKSKYYKILGLPNNASESEVRKKYRKLVMQYHPDKNPTASAEAKFILIKDAYEIVMNKKPMPSSAKLRRRPTGASARKKTSNQENTEAQREQRAKEAKERFREQRYKEYVENEMYFRTLTKGVKWKTMRISAIVGIVLSILLITDFFLPHHYEPDRITHYHLNSAYGLNGAQVSLIQTKSGDKYWIEHLNYSLYGRHHKLYVESTWIFHNPIRLINHGKVENNFYEINFNFYRVTWLLIILFLLPTFTMLYKRRKIAFTVLFHFCYYGVNAMILIFLLTGHRWAHVLTLGFL